MAIDTAERRKSVVAIPYPWAGVSVTPNATKDQEWRQEAGWGYPGILAAGFTQATTLGDLTFLLMDEYVVELKAANPNAADVDTLIRDDLGVVRGAVIDQDDMNTMYAIYISST